MGRHEDALKILHGGTVIPAIPLVLDANRKFDEAGQRTLIRYYLAAGVGGIAVAVHTTQFEIRKPEIGLFEPVLRVAADEINAFEARTGKTIVRVAGVCGEAAQACAEAQTAKDLGFDMSKVNVNGGAIALGHPVGASGCRILVTLLHEMQKRDAKRGLATLCIGGGMGCSTIVERD